VISEKSKFKKKITERMEVEFFWSRVVDKTSEKAEVIPIISLSIHNGNC